MPAMNFKQAVASTPDIATGFQPGLAALGQYRTKIEVNQSHYLQGSVDIDSCTAQKYPQDNRWDYAFAYNSEVFFAEMHAAHTSEVRIVLKKLKWLKSWLNRQAPEISKLKAKNITPYYWIQSKNFHILKNSPQYRAAIQERLLPIPKLVLN